MYVCVCVCMYVYMCVCVCVCVDRSQEFFLLSLLRMSCSVFLRVNKRPGYFDVVFSKVFICPASFSICFAVSFFFSRPFLPRSKKWSLIEGFKPSAPVL